MKSPNDKSHSTRVPAENYRERARAVLERMLVPMRALSKPNGWKEPTEAQMEGFIDGFHHVLNWALEGAKRLGFTVRYYPGPLTEQEMQRVESQFLVDVTTVGFDRDSLSSAKRNDA